METKYVVTSGLIVKIAKDREQAEKIQKQLTIVMGGKWVIKELKDLWELTYSK
jgi:hypothetical protein